MGLPQDEAVWDVTVFTKNRDRLLKGEGAEAFFRQVSGQARAAGLLSDEHSTVDGALLEACAGQKSFRPKDEPGSGGRGGASGGRDFHGERRTNETHASTTDDEARLYKKGPGKEAKLCTLGHVVADNRHGLLVGTQTTLATGTAEREAAEKSLRRARRRRRATVGADKGYDSRAFVEATRAIGVTPHVAQNTSNRSSAIDERTTRHAGFEISQWKRKLVEQPFGWMMTVGLMPRPRSRHLIRAMFYGERFAAEAAAERVDVPRSALSSTPSKAARGAGSRRRFEQASYWSVPTVLVAASAISEGNTVLSTHTLALSTTAAP